MIAKRPRLTAPATFVLGLMLASALRWPFHFAAAETAPPCVPPAEAQEVPSSETPTTETPSVPTPATEEAPDTTAEDSTEPTETLPSETPSETPAATPLIRFSAVFPDPTGTDTEREFMEIENYGAAAADLAGWTVSNASGKSFTLSASLAAAARLSLPYAETHISLVNSGMTLYLKNSAGEVVDTLAYGTAKTEKTYARGDDGLWAWIGGEEIETIPTSTSTTTAETPATTTPSTTTPTPTTTNAPVTTTTTTATPTTVPSTVTPPDIDISEFIPDPTGSDDTEWIELRNNGASVALLDGLLLDDTSGGSSPYSLNGLTIPAQGWLLLPKAQTKLSLNNDTDDVRILKASGEVLKQVPYANPPAGKSYALVGGTWGWTDTPTPGTENIGASTPAVALSLESSGSDDSGVGGEDGPDAAEGEDGEAPAESVSLADVADIDETQDELMQVAAVVTLAPGRIGKRTFAVSDAGGMRGVIVRAYGSQPLPALKAGDVVHITGRASGSAESLLFATTGKGVVKVSTGLLPLNSHGLADFGADDVGLPVSVQGKIVRLSNASMSLADGDDNQLVVRLAAPLKGLAKGATVEAHGVIRLQGDVPELIAIDKASVMAYEAPADAPAEQLTGATGANVPTDNEALAEKTVPARAGRSFSAAAAKRPKGVVIAIVLAAAAAGGAGLYLRKKQLSTDEDVAPLDAMEPNR